MLPVTRLLPLKILQPAQTSPQLRTTCVQTEALRGRSTLKLPQGVCVLPASVFFPVSLLIQNVCLENGEGSCHGMAEVKGIPFPLGSTCFSCLASPSVETLEPY